MKITAARTRGPRTWVRMAILTAGLALLVASAPQPAGAEEKQDPVAAGTQQARNCELMGGDAHVEVERTVEGVQSVLVICTGGFADGILCDNTQSGTNCVATLVTGSPDWPVFEQAPIQPASNVIELLKSGSVAQINELVDDPNSAKDQGPTAQPSLARADNQDHDQDTNQTKLPKGKQHKKHGHGKGRKN